MMTPGRTWCGRGEPPTPAGAGLARVEMVSHGEYLNAAATELSRAATPVQRDLRLYGIAASVRPMVGAAGSPLSAALGRLAEAARDAIGRGAASHTIADFLAQLKEGASALASAQSGDEQRIAERVVAAAAALAKLTKSQATRAMSAIVDEPAPRQTMPREPTPAPADAAAPTPAPAPPQVSSPPPSPASGLRPAEASGLRPAEAPVLGEADFATSFMTLDQLIAERGMPAGNLEEFLGLAPARTTGPREAGAMSKGEPAIVPIESLAPPVDDAVPAVQRGIRDAAPAGAEAAARRRQGRCRPPPCPAPRGVSISSNSVSAAAEPAAPPPASGGRIWQGLLGVAILACLPRVGPAGHRRRRSPRADPSRPPPPGTWPRCWPRPRLFPCAPSAGASSSPRARPSAGSSPSGAPSPSGSWPTTSCRPAPAKSCAPMPGRRSSGCRSAPCWPPSRSSASSTA